MGHPQRSGETGTNWRDKDAAESTAADRDRDRHQDRREVVRGTEAAIGRHAAVALTHAGCVANARAMAVDAIGARSGILKEREQRGEVQRQVRNKAGQRFFGTIDTLLGVRQLMNLSNKLRGIKMSWDASKCPLWGGADMNDAPGPPIDRDHQ